MRVAVVSDSHQGMVHLKRFVEYCEAEGIEQVFHLGDVMEDVRYLQDNLKVPVAAVAGNCDVFSRHQREVAVTIENKRFLLVHGDKYGVKTGYDRLSYHADEMTCNMALFGHTHQTFSEDVGGVMLVNPGTLLNGRAAESDIDGDKIAVRHVRV